MHILRCYLHSIHTVILGWNKLVRSEDAIAGKIRKLLRKFAPNICSGNYDMGVKWVAYCLVDIWQDICTKVLQWWWCQGVKWVCPLCECFHSISPSAHEEQVERLWWWGHDNHGVDDDDDDDGCEGGKTVCSAIKSWQRSTKLTDWSTVTHLPSVQIVSRLLQIYRIHF